MGRVAAELRERIGMTGLSGGGWQTIVLSALDERVRASAPVAGFNGMAAKAVARAHGDIGDIEQSATDLFRSVDYPHLAALVAPRPLLLAFNADDECCFRAGMVKPVIETPARAIFELYGRGSDLVWHENLDPGTHNDQLDNRDLARRIAAGIRREPRPPAAARERLASVVRHTPARIEDAWRVASTKQRGVETASYLFRMSDGLSAGAVWLRAVSAPADAPDLFCLDLYKEFDVATLAALAAPTPVR